MTPSHPRSHWFEHDRFGLFVHFGPYSVAGRHEWVMNYEELTVAEYARYVRFFEPDLFDARAVVRAARDAGARYAVLTAKHHDGFCLWPTKQGDYSSGVTIGRDLVREFVEAARAEGIHVGLYYSLLDWHHPHYTIDRHHPQRNADDVAERNARRDWHRYRDYLHAQVRELLTEYGQIDYLFFDFTEPAVENGLPGKSAADWDAEGLLALCRELQPDMIVNDRLGIPADLVTPEQYQPLRPLEHDGGRVLWEACQTLNGSWGYHRDNLNFKSPELLVTMLVDTVSKGGNLLLNVGPTGRGEIAARDRATLDGIGAWMRHHSASIHGAGPSSHTPPPHATYTQRGDRLYVHVHTWPFGHLHLPELAGRIRFARLLHDGSEVLFTQIPPDQQANTMTPAGPPPGTATLLMPVQRPDVLLPVVEVVLEEP